MAATHAPLVDGDNQRVRRRRRDDLFHFESTSAPRPADVCQRFVGRVVPTWGFVMYGVLYLLVSHVCMLVGVLLGYLLGVGVGAKGATWVDVLALIRDGELVDGQVIDAPTGSVAGVAKHLLVDVAARRTGVQMYRVMIAPDQEPRVLQVPTTGFSRPGVGTKLRVLFHPASQHALVFEESGAAVVARVP
jgi:hypothetical protein